jgi:hypothetical protein
MKKKEKIYKFNKKALSLKLEAMKLKLERKTNQRPTERQKANLASITDEKKKQEKIERYKRLEEDIRFIEKDIKLIEKQIDDLSFNYEDLKNEMKKRNLAKFYTNLTSFAIIRFID